MSGDKVSQEESLSTALDRQLHWSKDAQQQIANFTSDLTRLKASITSLKSQKSALQNEVSFQERDKVSLLSEIARIKNERDSLQLEYSGMLDEAQFYRHADALASVERDPSGKATRALWLQTEKARELEQQLATVERAKQEELIAEKDMVAALRAQIAELQRGMREREHSSAARKAQSKTEKDHDKAVLEADLDKLRHENIDIKDALRAEKKARRTADTRAEQLGEKLHAAQEDARALQRKMRTAEEECDALQAQLDDIDKSRSKSPRALQPMSENITISGPRTPTKSRSAPSSRGSPNAPPAPAPAATTNSDLASRYEYLSRKHRELKAQFDAMRSKYAKDIQHWKEYRAIQVARSELRQKMRNERRANGESVGSAPPSAPPSMPPSSAGPFASSDMGEGDFQPSPSGARQTAEVSGSRTPLARTTVSAPAPSSQRAQAVNLESIETTSTPSKAPPLKPTTTLQTPAVARTIALKATTTLKSTTSIHPSELVTPKRGSELSSTRQPSRVTPWLGQSKRKVGGESSRKPRTSISFSDDEDDNAPDHALDNTPSGGGVHTPLVRDRTGTGSNLDSLRRAALQRSVTHVGAGGVPDSVPETPDARDKKRKLDHEGLSPAERALERKKLSKLSTSERREVYAAYKGKGRYVPPEELEKRAADEYEVDPAKNDGNAHAFHSVVRNKDERKKMHGGDCECCRDYYAAVGPLPRFNAPPRWNSPEKNSVEDDAEEQYNAQLVDHQNRISRHREVWRRPPTPPDYWKIGFPTTQDVARVNEQAAEMSKKRDAEVRREAAHKDSKWRKK